MLQTLSWTGSAVRLLDQTRLPSQTVYVEITDERQMWDAIKRLVVRGAPAIGVSAAFGVYLGVRHASDELFPRRLSEVCKYLATSRPTAINLFWAIERIEKVANTSNSPASSKQKILDEALNMLAEDNAVCRKIGEYGVQLLAPLKDQAGVINLLTHCNAGGLATVQWGTALAPIYVGHEQGLKFHIYADETRPLLQGSRITAYELQQNGIPVTVICDNMAGALMRQKQIHLCVVGADRIAANGDVANKIGTYSVAVLAKAHNIPFYVAAPYSTIDLKTRTGDEIPIEQRNSAEVSHVHGGPRITPEGVRVYNPAFDITPAELISGIITERGVFRPEELEQQFTTGGSSRYQLVTPLEPPFL